MFKPRPDLSRWISRLIIGVGFLWIVILIVQGASTIREQFLVIDWFWLAGAFVTGAAYLLLSAIAFGILLRLNEQRRFGWIYVARLIFAGQILRHLPGRLWGVVYLLNETRQEVSSAGMLRANVVFMALSLVLHMLISLTLSLFFYVGLVKALLWALLGFSGIAIALRRDGIGTCLSLAARWLPTRWLPDTLSESVENLKETRPMAWAEVGKIVLILMTMGGMNVVNWHTLVWSFPELAHINVWMLCAVYSIAWISGYLSIVTPSGLGVREAVFMMLGSNVMELPSLAFLSVFVRLWLIALELMLFLLFFFQKPKPEPSRAFDHMIG